MRKAWIRIAVITVFGAALLLPWTLAEEELAESMGIKCTACHDKAGSKLLTSKGKYFELKRSFDGYDEVMKKYRKCTKCHAKFPGSQKLTRKGEALKESGVTMDHVIAEPTKE